MFIMFIIVAVMTVIVIGIHKLDLKEFELWLKTRQPFFGGLPRVILIGNGNS